MCCVPRSLTAVRGTTALLKSVAGDPAEVVQTLVHAVSSVYPRTRYRVGKDVLLYYPLSLLPAAFSDRVLQLLDVYETWRVNRKDSKRQRE